MPIVIPKDLPAYQTLSAENIFVMNTLRAESQDIRPIEIAIVNLMPTKIETETQLMRLLGNSSLQINISLITMDTYQSTHISPVHLDRFYTTFAAIKNKKFDGMIITGAPVETLAFEDVKYWQELTEIMDYADKNVTSTIFICWGAQAGLYYHYGINKNNLKEKMFGIFPCRAVCHYDPLLKGMDDLFNIPMSRHTAIDEKAVMECDDLEVMARGKECGISIIKSKDGKKFFFVGHSEYDRDTLLKEYRRDLDKGLKIKPPFNYFNETGNAVDMSWASTANLLYYNWLNYYVYQVTPYDINEK